MLKICVTHIIQSQVAKSVENKTCKILLQILLARKIQVWIQDDVVKKCRYVKSSDIILQYNQIAKIEQDRAF